MKLPFLIILQLLFSAATYAQDSTAIKYVKLNLAFSSFDPIHMEGLEAYFGIHKGKWSHEWGIDKLRSEVYYDTRRQQVVTSYKAMFALLNTTHDNIFVYVGARPYMRHNTKQPLLSPQFGRSDTQTGIEWNLGAGYRLRHRKVFFDTQFEFPVYGVAYRRERNFDPALSKQQQIKTRYVYGSLDPGAHNWIFKLGVGLVIA